MDDFDAPFEPVETQDNTVALFLGLYLVVLAFFILLVTISTLEESKSQRVMDSLTSEFTSILPPTASLQHFQAKDGDILAGQEFQEQITGIFPTALQVVAQVEKVQPGRLMRVTLETDALFADDAENIRTAMYPMLDRMVAALSNRPQGQRFDIEIVMGIKTVGSLRTMPIAATLEMRRLGAFARDMHSRGLPPDAVSVGLRPGHEGEIVMWFYTRDIDETKLRFDEGEGK